MLQDSKIIFITKHLIHQGASTEGVNMALSSMATIIFARNSVRYRRRSPDNVACRLGYKMGSHLSPLLLSFTVCPSLSGGGSRCNQGMM